VVNLHADQEPPLASRFGMHPVNAGDRSQRGQLDTVALDAPPLASRTMTPQVLHGASGHEPPTRDHHDAVADGIHLRKVVAREEDRAPLGQRPHELPEGLRLRGIHSGTGLVKDEHRRLGHERRSKPDALRHSAAEPTAEPPLEGPKRAQLDHLGDRRERGSPRHSPQSAPVRKPLADGQVGRKRAPLRQVPHQPPRECAVPRHIAPADRHAAPVGAERSHDDAQRRGLAGAIRAEESARAVGRNLEGEVADCVGRAEPSADLVDDDHASAAGPMRGPASVRRGVHFHAVTDPASPAPVHDAHALLSEIADGVGLVSESGEILWMAPRLAALDADRLRLFATACVEAGRDVASQPRRARRRRFPFGDSFYEVVVTTGAPGTLVGVLIDVTARQRLADRIEMVDALGAELLDLDAQIVNPLNVTERLDLLEDKVIEAMRHVMRGEPFEIRLRDRRSDQLEVVITQGLEPLRIGDTIHARASGHGISGFVAASGTSVICSDPDHDERYLPGLPGARSSLTVPLLLKDRVSGVINVESMRESAFDDADRIALETYGRYVAMALNILDMLIVERTTTSARVSTMLRDELIEPARRLREAATHVASGRLDGYESLERALESLEARIRSVTAGPQTVLGVDRVVRDGSLDPAISGKRILVADDETQIRETIRGILQSCGATVDIRGDGAGAIDAVVTAARQREGPR